MDNLLFQKSTLSALKGRVFIKDRNLEFIYCNDAFAWDLNLSSRDVVGADDYRLFPDDIAINNRNEDRHVLETGRSLNHIKKHYSRDRELWVRVSKEPYLDEEGRIIGVLGILEDIPYEQSCWRMNSHEDAIRHGSSSQNHIIVWEWEMGSDNFIISENAETILGEKIDLERRINPESIIYDQDRKRVIDEVNRAIRDKRFFSIELRIPLSNELKWFYTTGGIIKNPHDCKNRLYGIARDISEWKSGSSGFNPYRSAYELSAVPELFMDREGNLIHCNSAFMELWQIGSSRELPGQKIHDFWVKNGELDRCIREILSEKGSWQGELDALRADGSVFRTFVILHELHDENGRPLNIAATVIDLTEQKALLEHNRSLARKFERLLKTTQDGFWAIDSKGFFTEVNDSACRMLEYDREEFLKLHIRDVDIRENNDDVLARISDIRECGVQQFKALHQTRSGRILDVEVSTIYCPEGDSFFALIRNVTERENLMKDLIRTKKNLEEMNTALRVVLNNKEKEAEVSSQNINRTLQKTVMPLLYQLKMENCSHHEKIIDQLIINLQTLQSPPSDKLLETLSPREYQVARYIVQSLSSKEIADLMGMSLRTVESYRLTIRKKLKLNNTHRNLRSELESLLM